MAIADWIAVYDVSDDATRRRVARALEGHGHRVLYSVFELQASPAVASMVFRRIVELIDPGDRAVLLPRCERCGRAGTGGSVEPDPPGALVI